MSIVTDSPQTVNSLAHFDHVYAGMVFDEMCQFAAQTYTEKVADGVPMMPWDDFVNAYRQVWGASRNVDFSAFPNPPAPVVAAPDVDTINAALADDPDYQDFLAQTMTGIPMF